MKKRLLFTAPSSTDSQWVNAPLTARDVQMDVDAAQLPLDSETRVETMPGGTSDTGPVRDDMMSDWTPSPQSGGEDDLPHHEPAAVKQAAAALDFTEITEDAEPAPSSSTSSPPPSGPRMLTSAGKPAGSYEPLEQILQQLLQQPQEPSPGHAAAPVLADDHPHMHGEEAAAAQPHQVEAAAAAAPLHPAAADDLPDKASGSSPDMTRLDSTQLQQRTDSTISNLGVKLRRVSQTLTTVLVGDDDTVHDKWDDYDDDVEEEIEAVKRGLSMTRRSGKHMRPNASSKVHPAASAGSGTGSRRMSILAMASIEGSSADPNDVLGEKRSGRTLIWHYCQTFIFSSLLAAVGIPLVTLMSLVQWHEEVGIPSDTLNNSTDTSPPPLSGVRPNHKAMQLLLLFQIIFPLCLYAALLYACIRRSLRLPWPMVVLVVCTIAWATLVCGLFYKFDVAFWFYYIDLFVIVAAYVPCMCLVGWYVEVDENASTKQRLMDVFFTAILETVVAAATLVYCFFIMPLFFILTNAWLQMLWLCVLHPLYFEATTGFIVRKVLQRNRQLGRNHILYLLTIVHSMVHVVVLATSLQASIEPVRILTLTVLLYNVSKLTWRSTVLQRDLFIERLFHGWSFNYSIDELAELARMVSVGIITEIILENASICIAPFMMFRMYKEPIFMAVVPNTFYNNGGTYPVQTLFILIALLLTFTMIFDLAFYFLNYHMIQHLPLINTWRRIKRSQGWYLAFLVYAFATMGVLFLFLTMMILPRAAYCRTDDYCDCSTLAYKTICEGQYISTLVDYLV